MARVTKAGPVVKLDAVCEELERVRRSGTVLLDEMFERQRRRTHLEDFAAAALLDTDGPAWVDAQGNETSLDAAVLNFGELTAYPSPVLTEPDTDRFGASFLLWDNLWGALRISCLTMPMH